MSLAERILLSLCRSPEAHDYHLSDDDVRVENALDLLDAQFGPEVLQHIQGKTILDYGCGYGKQAVGYLLNGASHVTAVDIREDNIVHTKALAEQYGVGDRLSLLLGDIHDIDLPKDFFDTAISCDAFEHFADPEGILRVCYPALKPQGRFLITFGDPWFHPYGSHMQFFTKLPWVHVLFSEKTVMQVRTRFRHDRATRYHEVEGGLNQMTVWRFMRLVRSSGYTVELCELYGIKKMDFLTWVPSIREFFTNRVNAILRKDSAAPSIPLR